MPNICKPAATMFPQKDSSSCPTKKKKIQKLRLWKSVKSCLRDPQRVNVWAQLDRIFYTFDPGGAWRINTCKLSHRAVTWWLTPTSPPEAVGMCHHVSFCTQSVNRYRWNGHVCDSQVLGSVEQTFKKCHRPHPTTSYWSISWVLGFPPTCFLLHTAITMNVRLRCGQVEEEQYGLKMTVHSSGSENVSYIWALYWSVYKGALNVSLVIKTRNEDRFSRCQGFREQLQLSFTFFFLARY